MEIKTIYTEDVIAHLELGWGEGWLSPGGIDDLAALLSGADISGKSVLDIGVGAAGPAIELVRRFGARHVVGVDVERSVLDRAQALVTAAGLGARIELRHVTGDRLPFPDGHFDVVFSKDSIIHITDKGRLFREANRVLGPRGLCVFSDWCCGTEPFSAEMREFLGNGMDFAMTTPDAMSGYLSEAGFSEISVRDRNPWFVEIADAEYREATGDGRAGMVRAVGQTAADRISALARRRAIVARQGHLRPTHFMATKSG